MYFAFLYVPTSANQGDLTAVEKRLVPKFVAKLIDCTGHFMCLEKVLVTDSSDSTAAHTVLTLLVLLSRKALRKLKRIAET